VFIGHYGPAAAAAGKKLKLWHCFVAVQFLDILWAPLVLLGIEQVRIVENFTASNHFDLYHMPYTHSLVMAIFWSVLAGFAYHLWRRANGGMIGALVFSHWVLDFVVHKPDLELWFGGPKVGLGLWDYRPVAVSLEFALMLIGMSIYLKVTRPKGIFGKIAPLLLLLALSAAQIFANFGPPPSDAKAAALLAILAYTVFIGLAAMTDATRQTRRFG